MKKSIRQVTTSILIAVMLLLPGCANKEPDMVEQSPNTEGQTAPLHLLKKQRTPSRPWGVIWKRR